MYYKVTFEGDTSLTIQADTLDEAWDKAKRLGKVVKLVEIKF